MVTATGVALLMVVVLGCRKGGPVADTEFLMEPDEWASHTRQSPTCGIPVLIPDTAQGTLSLSRPAGTLWLPRGTRELPTTTPDARKWMLPDSSRVDLWVTENPAAGLATSGNVQVDLDHKCWIPVATRPALVLQFRLIDTARLDTTYGATVHTLLERGLALNLFVEAPSAAARRAALSAISAFRLQPRPKKVSRRGYGD